MLLTENTTNDTCQSNLRGAWNDVSTGTQKLRLLSASSLSVYIVREAEGQKCMHTYFLEGLILLLII